MKKLLLLLFLFVSYISFSQVKLGGTISQTSTADNYPTHADTTGFAGYRVVADTFARNNLKSSYREIGMIVYCRTQNKTYQLIGGTTNNYWTVYSGGSTSLFSDVLQFSGNAYKPYGTQTTGGRFDSSATAPVHTNPINWDGYLYATKIFSAGSQTLVSNDTTVHNVVSNTYLTSKNYLKYGTSTDSIINHSSAIGTTATSAITYSMQQGQTRIKDLQFITYTPAVSGSISSQKCVYIDSLNPNYAYQVAQNTVGWLLVYDITNKRNPILKGSVQIYDTHSNQPQCVLVQNGYAYIGVSADATASGHLMFVVNVSNPLNPTVVGYTPASLSTNKIYALVKSGNYVYMASQTAGLICVDVTSPTSPSIIYTQGGGLRSAGIDMAGSNVVLHTTRYHPRGLYRI